MPGPPTARPPQVTIPLAKVDGLPVGLSLLGPAGTDEALMELAERVAAAATAAGAGSGGKPAAAGV
jgi:Asp-tRNA(Asn)/Glu-tRNA(Gln) amidotransferase A subunit family amidase